MFEEIKSLFFDTPLGLKKLPQDNRDLGFNWLFGTDYEPKHKTRVLEPLSVKTQKWNTCGWAASVASKEIDEKVKLSIRVFVIIGKFLGYISGDGFSNLRDNEKALQKMGVAEEGVIPESADSWEEYSDTSLLTEEVKTNAAKHKSKSFWRIYNTSEIYKAIDDGRPVKIGVRWYYGLNMSGGFCWPWLYKIISWLVGGHAMFVRGYNTDYQGQKVFIVRNSFGIGYGDKGDLYITEEDLQKEIELYGAFANLDETVEVGKWLAESQGKVVKTIDNQNVYLIQGNQKRLYPDEPTLIAHGKDLSDIIIVEAEILDQVQAGEKINFWDGGNVKQVRAMIQQREELKTKFKKYFNELF
ncbi:MAG TPA: hypothetical protein PKZ42_01805 [Syntrophales bacterium]|nr:hypothetical protein [Syntrophales bacterium]